MSDRMPPCCVCGEPTVTFVRPCYDEKKAHVGLQVACSPRCLIDDLRAPMTRDFYGPWQATRVAA